MKITRPFSPVTITFETEMEYKYLLDQLWYAHRNYDTKWRMCGTGQSREQTDLYYFIEKLEKAVK